MQAATANPPRTSVNHKHISGRAHEQEGGRNVLGRETAAKNARREVFVNAMSAAVTGVNLITTDGRAGRFGVTVSAMCSVSADPPILLACVNRRSPACSAILSNQVFCVNVLSIRQRNLADVFAGRTSQDTAYDFSLAQWDQGSNAAPRLAGATSTFDCQLEHAYDSGSHKILVARVTAATKGSETPLLYADRAYGIPCQPE